MKKILSGWLALAMALNLGTISANAMTVKSNRDKISFELSDTLKNSSFDIPVYIWYNGINENEVEEEIENKIGFNEESLDFEFDMASEELISALSTNDDDNIKYLMSSHIKKTEPQRKKEKEKTDIYLKCRKELLADIYNKKGNEIIESLGLSAEKVKYISHYSPVIVAELSSDEILKVAENSNVDSVSLYDCINPEICTIGANNHIKDVMGVSKINQSLNLNGEGVGIGIIDLYNIEERDCDSELSFGRVTHVGTEWYESSNANNNYTHTAYCATVAAGTNGVASGSDIYDTSYHPLNDDSTNYNYQMMPNLEALIGNNNVGVISISLAFGRESNYSNFEKYVDRLISETKATIVVASGNNDNSVISSPGLAYNVITVNGFHEEGINTSQYRKVLDSYSYMNDDGCCKPDIIADSLNNGTSTATPVVAGMIALLYQYKPSLKAFPELTKAILTASCHEKLEGELLSEGLSDRQGAGIPNMYSMISIVAQHSYYVGTINSSYSKVNFIQPKYNASKINVSLAFLQNPSNPADLDLILYGSTNSVIGSSLNDNSSTELIYNQLISESDRYSFKILNQSGAMNLSYACAWSTEKAQFIPATENEGVFYIKNNKSDYYMTLNTSTMRLYQSAFADSNTQKWSLKSNGSSFKIQTSATQNKQMFFDSSYIAKVTSSLGSSGIKIVNNNDGTISFKKISSGIEYGLGVSNNSTAANAQLVWSTYSASNKSQKWSLELIGYKRGDIDRNGILNSNDVEAIIDIYNSIRSETTHTYDDVQIYLADFDGNGTINVLDASYLVSLIGT